LSRTPSAPAPSFVLPCKSRRSFFYFLLAGRSLLFFPPLFDSLYFPSDHRDGRSFSPSGSRFPSLPSMGSKLSNNPFPPEVLIFAVSSFIQPTLIHCCVYARSPPNFIFFLFFPISGSPFPFPILVSPSSFSFPGRISLPFSTPDYRFCSSKTPSPPGDVILPPSVFSPTICDSFFSSYSPFPFLCKHLGPLPFPHASAEPSCSPVEPFCGHVMNAKFPFPVGHLNLD